MFPYFFYGLANADLTFLMNLPGGNRGRARSMDFTRRRDRLTRTLFADDGIDLNVRMFLA